jgi:hypothetical protein
MKRAVAAAALLAAAALSFLSPAAKAQSVECRGDQKPRQVAELLFGRKIGDRLGVTEKVWAGFVDREITPRFPDGVSVIDVRGQWRDTGRNAIVHEPSKLVEIIMPGKDDDLDRLGEIAAAYKTRFHQQSVGIVVRAACVSF